LLTACSLIPTLRAIAALKGPWRESKRTFAAQNWHADRVGRKRMAQFSASCRPIERTIS
jgi:hypothetical protein